MTKSLSPSLADLQARFVAIMPRIEVHGQIYFRNERCPGKKDDCLAEMLALSWKWFVRLHEQGRDPTRFVSALASFAARAVRTGRRLCGQEKTRDVLSPLAQQRKGFVVCKLPEFSALIPYGIPFLEALIDNTRTPVPDQVSFRCDFPAWVKTHTDRNRRLIEALMMGERTLDVSSKHGISSARISQLRRWFMEDW